MGRFKQTLHALLLIGLLGLAFPRGIPDSDATVVIEVHHVKSGESLEQVAAKYGVSIDCLRKKNGLLPNHHLRAGDTLVVPVSDKARARLQAAADSSSSHDTALKASAALTSETSGQTAGKLLVSEVYYAKAGDTLARIAQAFDVSLPAIIEKNNLPSGAMIQPGQMLIIPVREAVVHKPATSGAEGDVSGKAKPPSDAASPPSTTKTNSIATSDGKVVGKLGVICANGARIRRTRSPNGRTVYTCSQDTQLLIINQKDGWYGVMMIDGSTCWVPAKYVKTLDVELVAGKTESGSSAQRGNGIVSEAYRYLGIPYYYGGASLSGMDCSAFVRRVFASRGYYLPRTAAEQFYVGAPIGYEQLQPGDRLYFSGSGRRVDHASIYIGNGQMIHASGHAGCVTVDNFFSPKYWSMFVGARR